MGITRGKDLLLKIDDGTGSFVTVGGLRTKTLSLSTGIVDVTNADSGAWRELLPCGGIRQVNISGSGLFIDDAAAEQARTLFFSGEHSDWEIFFPEDGTFSGPFQITNLDYAGDFRGEATFAMSLASAGEIIFTPEAP